MELQLGAVVSWVQEAPLEKKKSLELGSRHLSLKWSEKKVCVKEIYIFLI